MGAEITAYYVRTEEILALFYEAAQFPADSDERYDIIYDYLDKEFEDDYEWFGTAYTPYHISDTTEYVLGWLPETLRREFEIFDAILLNGFWTNSGQYNSKYEAEIEAVGISAWIVDRQDLRRVKEASIFLDYVRSHQERMQSEQQQFFIRHLSHWVETVNSAIDRDRELLIERA